MKAKRLKALLRRALERVDKLDDLDEVKVQCNTYFLDGSELFLGLSGEGYVSLDELDVEKAIKITDVDLCIALDGEQNPEPLKTYDELRALGNAHDVRITLENEKSESGWPSFAFEGNADDIVDVLSDLGFDEETIDEMLKE